MFYARTFALLTAALLAYLLYLVLSPLAQPIAWALFIAFLLHPLHAWLTRRLRGRAAVSAALLVVLTFVIVIGPLGALGAAFAAQVTDLARYAQEPGRRAQGHRDLGSRNHAGHRPGARLGAGNRRRVAGADPGLGGAGGAGDPQGPRHARPRRVPRRARHRDRLRADDVHPVLRHPRRPARRRSALRDLVPIDEREKSRLFDHLASVTRALVYGTGVTAVVQGVMVGAGFAAVGLPSPVVFGVLAALAALIPMAGTPVVWVPAVIVLAMQDRYTAALILLAWGGIITTMDNFLRPWLVSGRAEVGAITVFIGVLGGVSAFGPIGIFLGPLVLALALALVRFALETRQAA